jgi:hypothetical protein
MCRSRLTSMYHLASSKATVPEYAFPSRSSLLSCYDTAGTAAHVSLQFSFGHRTRGGASNR